MSWQMLVTLSEYFDPLSYVSEETYWAWWGVVFQTFFQGTMARFAAFVCLFGAVWYGAYKQRFGLGLMFFAMTVMFAYVAGVARVLRMGE